MRGATKKNKMVTPANRQDCRIKKTTSGDGSTHPTQNDPNQTRFVTHVRCKEQQKKHADACLVGGFNAFEKY